MLCFFFKKLTNNSYRPWIRHYTKPCKRNQNTGLDEYFSPFLPFTATSLITLKASNFRLSTEYIILTKSKNRNQMRPKEKTNSVIPIQGSLCYSYPQILSDGGKKCLGILTKPKKIHGLKINLKKIQYQISECLRT